MDRPALWWPNGQGSQPLHTLHADLRLANGKLSDARATRFGIHDLRWVHTEGAPADFISRYQLVINGRPVRTIGSGLIQPETLPGCGLPHELQLLRQAQAAGMNFLRINGGGGGAPLPESWYDLADELGIMISHEFPIGNCSPETEPVFLANLETTVRSMLKQYRNHPSIIEFVGGNEMSWNSTARHPALQLMQKLAAEETDQLFRDLPGPSTTAPFAFFYYVAAVRLGGDVGDRAWLAGYVLDASPTTRGFLFRPTCEDRAGASVRHVLRERSSGVLFFPNRCRCNTRKSKASMDSAV